MSDTHHHDKDVSTSVGPAHKEHDMHLGLYLGVGGFLLFATALTVWLSYVDFGKSKGEHHRRHDRGHHQGRLRRRDLHALEG